MRATIRCNLYIENIGEHFEYEPSLKLFVILLPILSIILLFVRFKQSLANE